MAERLDTLSSVKLGRFLSKLKAPCVSNHTEELTQQNSLWMTICARVCIGRFLFVSS